MPSPGITAIRCATSNSSCGARCLPLVGARRLTRVGAIGPYAGRCEGGFALSVQVPLRVSVRGWLRLVGASSLTRVGARVGSPCRCKFPSLVGASLMRVGARELPLVGQDVLRVSVRGWLRLGGASSLSRVGASLIRVGARELSRVGAKGSSRVGARLASPCRWKFLSLVGANAIRVGAERLSRVGVDLSRRNAGRPGGSRSEAIRGTPSSVSGESTRRLRGSARLSAHPGNLRDPSGQRPTTASQRVSGQGNGIGDAAAPTQQTGVEPRRYHGSHSAQNATSSSCPS